MLKSFLIATVAIAGARADSCADLTKLAEYSACAAQALVDGGTDKCKLLNAVVVCAEAADCPATLDVAKKVAADQGCAGCFPATATVELSNGKIKSMDQVKIGDSVRVGPKEFSEVYFFSSELASTTSKFKKIIAEGAELLLTHHHYLYVNGDLRPAGSVKVGDVIVLANGTKASVNAIDEEWAPGLYNPHTLHGDVIVNGVRTSTYTEAVHPKLAHALLAPIRAMYSAGVAFGSSFSGQLKALPMWVQNAVRAA